MGCNHHWQYYYQEACEYILVWNWLTKRAYINRDSRSCIVLLGWKFIAGLFQFPKINRFVLILFFGWATRWGTVSMLGSNMVQKSFPGLWFIVAKVALVLEEAAVVVSLNMPLHVIPRGTFHLAYGALPCPVLKIGFGPLTADCGFIWFSQKTRKFQHIQQRTKTRILCFGPTITYQKNYCCSTLLLYSTF